MTEPIKLGIDLKTNLRLTIRALIQDGYYNKLRIHTRLCEEIDAMVADGSLSRKMDYPNPGHLQVLPQVPEEPGD